MKRTPILLCTFALSLIFTAAMAQAATVTGTVTNKTTNKPSSGDTVVLVDVQAGMGEAAHATTDARGHYSLSEPGSGPYLIRATHQGAGYFIAAPQSGSTGDITVYDVAAKVEGVSIEADVLEVETVNGKLRVTERYFVHNTSTPPRTQWSQYSFEIVLPPEAVVAGAEAQRPSGLPTSLKLDPDGPKGHYAFNFPIQPDDGDKNTLFQLSYELPYSDGKFTFRPQLMLPTQNIGVLLPKSMTFTAAAGSNFQSVPEDPAVQTFVAKNQGPGKPLEFTISGNGSIPREGQGATATDSSNSAQQNSAPGNQPGGGIGAPIGTPDPLGKYKWWILAALALLLAVAAALLLRKPLIPAVAAPGTAANPVLAATSTAAGRNAALLNVLKEELFALESEKLSGLLAAGEYDETKAALETVLKRALKRIDS